MQHTRSPYYVELPRSHRLDRFVRQRTKIGADDQGRGVFSSRYMMPGGPQWNKQSSFSHTPHSHTECVFLSRRFARQGWWYDTEVCTVPQRVVEHWNALVEERLDAVLAAHGLQQDDVCGNSRFVKDPLTNAYTIETDPPPRLPGLGGQTIWHLKRQLWEEVSVDDCLTLTEGYIVTTKHRWGVGLAVTIPDEEVSVSTTIAAIERFWALGERSVSFPIDWDTHTSEIATAHAHQLEYVDFRLSEL